MEKVRHNPGNHRPETDIRDQPEREGPPGPEQRPFDPERGESAAVKAIAIAVSPARIGAEVPDRRSPRKSGGQVLRLGTGKQVEELDRHQRDLRPSQRLRFRIGIHWPLERTRSQAAFRGARIDHNDRVREKRAVSQPQRVPSWITDDFTGIESSVIEGDAASHPEEGCQYAADQGEMDSSDRTSTRAACSTWTIAGI